MKYSALLVLPLILLSACSGTSWLVISDTNTGWADYIDTEYNNTSPYNVSGGVYTVIPNNAGDIISNQTPIFINNTGGFYNGTHIIGNEYDMYGIGLRGVVQTVNPNTYCEFYINTSDAAGLLPVGFINFPKGVSTETDYKLFTNEFITTSWANNGGVITVLCNNDIQIFHNSLVIDNIHRAR